jgi:hypothetical protein
MRTDRDKTTLTIRLQTATAKRIAEVAATEHITQKQVIMRALVGAGVRIAPSDLIDGTPLRSAK